MKRKTIIYSFVLALLLGGFTACEDMLDVSSSSVQYEDRHDLNSAADSLYSVVGILSKLQTIADRTVLLGELRGDLVTDNENTEKDLRELINHNISADNVYNDYSDYYAIINNCNYYLAKVDTNVIVSNQKVMQREVAVVKAVRAWTYMQLALNYQSVPFITQPILTLEDAENLDKNNEHKDLDAICDYFIEDLLPYIDTDLPSYGEIGGYNSKRLFFPVALLLGDMSLWKQDYASAYTYYAYYLYKHELSTWRNGVSPGGINPVTNDVAGPLPAYSIFSDETIAVIRMASSKLHGTTSNLVNIFSPTDLNEGKRMVSPSRLWKELSEDQVCAYQQTENSPVRYFTCGDLRAIATYNDEWTDGTFNPSVGGSSEAWYVVDVDNQYKINAKYDGGFSLFSLAENNSIRIYRVGNVYLRLAEAVNRMGNPAKAFSILKYGVDITFGLTLEAPRADNESVVGIHSRGSGNSEMNEMYKIDDADFDYKKGLLLIDERLDTLAVDTVKNDMGEIIDIVMTDSIVRIRSYYGRAGMPNPNVDNGYYGDYLSEDSIVVPGKVDEIYNKKLTPDTVKYTYMPVAYLVDKVERMIVDEMALETAFEGHRYYDLMRVAMRREDPAFLAERVAYRNGTDQPRNDELFNKLNDPTYQNWFIHKK